MAFRCTEIRQNGPCKKAATANKSPCQIAAVFSEAKQLFRECLKAQTIAGISQSVASQMNEEDIHKFSKWIMHEMTTLVE